MVLARGYTSDFLFALVMPFFQTLSRRQREMKIAEIVARVATLQLFARACDATKEYLANEIEVRNPCL